MYDILDDTKRGFTGEGGQLNIWDDTLSKYVLFLPLETLPSVVGSYNTVDHDVTTSSSIGKIKGKMTIENKEVTFLWHRDNLIRLNQNLGKQCKFLVSYRDGTGWKFTAEYTYKPDDASASEKTTGTLTFIPSEVDDVATLDVTDMLARTCFITSLIDGEINLAVGESKTYSLTANVDGVSYSATSSATSVTVPETVTGESITITSGNTANKSAYVTLKAIKDGMNSWATTILVNVVEA